MQLKQFCSFNLVHILIPNSSCARISPYAFCFKIPDCGCVLPILSWLIDASRSVKSLFLFSGCQFENLQLFESAYPVMDHAHASYAFKTPQMTEPSLVPACRTSSDPKASRQCLSVLRLWPPLSTLEPICWSLSWFTLSSLRPRTQLIDLSSSTAYDYLRMDRRNIICDDPYIKFRSRRDYRWSD